VVTEERPEGPDWRPGIYSAQFLAFVALPPVLLSQRPLPSCYLIEPGIIQLTAADNTNPISASHAGGTLFDREK
jgi:hypothetical protein